MQALSISILEDEMRAIEGDLENSLLKNRSVANLTSSIIYAV